jgi:hypothetical protein
VEAIVSVTGWGDGNMRKSVRIVSEVRSANGQSITFVLAIGVARQTCRLQTTFPTQNQAFAYLHKHRTKFERVARERFLRSEIEDGVINLTML